MTKVCPSCELVYPDADHFCAADGTPLRSTAEASDDLVGTVIAERYLITELIGEGGMGRVYRARHVRVPREAAIKVLRKSLIADPYAVAAFNREARNAAMVGDHPNVAAVYDFGETPDGLVYLAMEFVEGETLARLLEREPVLAPARAAEIVRQIAAALTVAHELPEPVVHRDLKPDNIILKKTRDGTDWVKVVDFGIAKAARRETQVLTSPGLVVGTPRYMSPEQLTGAPIDARSDIYALALIAFQMLTGRLPFPSLTRTEESTLPWALKRLTTPASPLAAVRADTQWPDSLQDVFDRALASSAADRFATANEFSNALPRALETRAPESATAPAPLPPPLALPGGASAPAGPAPAPSASGGPGQTVRLPAGPGNARLSGAPRQARLLAWVGGAAALITLVAAGMIVARRMGEPAGGGPGGDSLPPARYARVDSVPAGGNARQPPDTAQASQPGSLGTGAKEPIRPPSSRSQGRGEPSSGTAGETRPKSNPGTSTERTPSRGADGGDRRSRAALEAIKAELADPDAVIAAGTGETVLRRIERLMPTLTSEADSVEASYYAVETNLILDRPTEACRVLLRMRGPARGTPFEGRVETYLANKELNCPAAP